MWTVGRALPTAVLLAFVPHYWALGGTCQSVGGTEGRGGRVVAFQKLVCNQVSCGLCDSCALMRGIAELQ